MKYIKLSFIILMMCMFTACSNEHSEKAYLAIFVTLFGIVIFVSDEHPEKAQQPISVTLFGIVIFTSDEHR